MAILGLWLPIWGWQLIIIALRATGLVGLAGSISLQVILYVEEKLKNLKTYHEANDFPSPPPATLTQNNLGAQKVQ